MYERINNILKEEKYKITILENKINIINYKRLITIDSDIITILVDSKMFKIKGSNLIPIKILDNEILIKGNIKSIEVINE